MPKWQNILDSYWHKDEKIPFSALEQMPITNIDGKVDKATGKELSTNDYTDAEKEKLSGLEQNWENTANGNLKTKIQSKVAINKEDAEYALDVANTPSIDTTTLSGTFSFDGFELTGTGTLMTSEIVPSKNYKMPNGDIVPSHDFLVVGDTSSYFFNAHPPFTDQTIHEVVVNSTLLNLFDLLKIEKTGTDQNQTIKFLANKLTEGDYLTDKVKGKSIVNISDLQDITGEYAHLFRVLGNQKIKVLFRKKSGVFRLEVAIEGNGVRRFSITENGDIILEGLPISAPAGSNQLYKDSNGFLKIG
jgi:hypothetical protein